MNIVFFFDENLLSFEVSIGKPHLYVKKIGTKIWFELRLLRIELVYFSEVDDMCSTTKM